MAGAKAAYQQAIDSGDEGWAPAALDRRRVARPAQMEKLIGAVGTVGQSQGPRLRALYGCMYYGMLRPSEAASLLLEECELPGQGWGRLEFSEVSSAAGRDWADDGEVHQASKPKGGPRNAIRRVPIPPVLVSMIREHVELFGTAPDGRLFRTCKGGIYLPSTLWTVLQKARKAAFAEAQQASLLARKPYDFRHAGISWRLNAGTPAPLVAEWAGHTVEVLLRIYAHCIDGDDDRWFGPMEDALGRADQARCRPARSAYVPGTTANGRIQRHLVAHDQTGRLCVAAGQRP